MESAHDDIQEDIQEDIQKDIQKDILEDIQVERIGDNLEGKTIALCISGGIASIESPKIARHLRRYGAKVNAYATETAYQFVGKAALEWATGRPVVDQLSGLAEHICREDLVLVAPATLNTINKIMAGIADNPLTTLISSALGKKVPVYLAPTMHESMFENPVLQRNLAQATAYGISIIPPRREEGKAKMPNLNHIVDEVCRGLSSSPLKGVKILITGGPAPVWLDEVRKITNAATGELSILIAKEAYRRGADIKLLLEENITVEGLCLDVVRHGDFETYHSNVFSELRASGIKKDDGFNTCPRYHIGIFSAAPSDYSSEKIQGVKIPSGKKDLNLLFSPTPKVIQGVRSEFPNLAMVTFKYCVGISKEELISIAQSELAKGYQLVVANRKEDIKEGHRAYIVGLDGILAVPKTKREIAVQLMNILEDGKAINTIPQAIRDANGHVNPCFHYCKPKRGFSDRVIDHALNFLGLNLTPYC